MLSSTTLTITVAITLLCSIGHLLIGLGIGWSIGPVPYDPAAFMVRGMVGAPQPGLETLFPRLLGCVYVSFGAGMLFATSLLLWGSSRMDSYPAAAGAGNTIRAALLPCIVYHAGALSDALNLFWKDTTSAAINTDKIDPMEPVYGHGLFLTLLNIAFFVAGSLNDRGGKGEKRS